MLTWWCKEPRPQQPWYATRSPEYTGLSTTSQVSHWYDEHLIHIWAILFLKLALVCSNFLFQHPSGIVHGSLFRYFQPAKTWRFMYVYFAVITFTILWLRGEEFAKYARELICLWIPHLCRSFFYVMHILTTCEKTFMHGPVHGQCSVL